MKKHSTEGAHNRARALRGAMTDGEKALWKLLRANQLAGAHFRRQVPIGSYIVDHRGFRESRR